jgi:hypothetical protein
MAGSEVGRDAIDVCGVEGCRRLDGRRGKAPETNKKTGKRKGFTDPREKGGPY